MYVRCGTNVGQPDSHQIFPRSYYTAARYLHSTIVCISPSPLSSTGRSYPDVRCCCQCDAHDGRERRGGTTLGRRRGAASKAWSKGTPPVPGRRTFGRGGKMLTDQAVWPHLRRYHVPLEPAPCYLGAEEGKPARYLNTWAVDRCPSLIRVYSNTPYADFERQQPKLT